MNSKQSTSSNRTQNRRHHHHHHSLFYYYKQQQKKTKRIDIRKPQNRKREEKNIDISKSIKINTKKSRQNMSTRNRHIIRVDSSRKPKYVKRRIGKKEKRILKLLASRRRGEETSKTSKLKELTLFSKFRKIKQMDMFGSDVRRHHRITNERSKVEELVVAENVVLALTRTGLCVAFDRDTKKLLTTLNASDHSLVRSIFHNRSLSSVIIVSVSEHDNFAALNCEEIKLEDIRSQNVREDTTSIVARLRLFTKETLRWPAFVEFVMYRLRSFPKNVFKFINTHTQQDDANEKILTFSSSECT